MKKNFTKDWKLSAAEQSCLDRGAALQPADVVQATRQHLGSAVRIYADAHTISYREAESIISKEFEAISEITEQSVANELLKERESE